MKAQVTSMGKDLLGVPINFDSDRALTEYKRGKPLTVGELRALPKGAVVWVWYFEGGPHPQINEAMRATRDDSLSRTGTEEVPGDEAECFNEGCEGNMRLFHAVPKER